MDNNVSVVEVLLLYLICDWFNCSDGEILTSDWSVDKWLLEWGRSSRIISLMWLPIHLRPSSSSLPQILEFLQFNDQMESIYLLLPAIKKMKKCSILKSHPLPIEMKLFHQVYSLVQFIILGREHLTSIFSEAAVQVKSEYFINQIWLYWLREHFWCSDRILIFSSSIKVWDSNEYWLPILVWKSAGETSNINVKSPDQLSFSTTNSNWLCFLQFL